MSANQAANHYLLIKREGEDAAGNPCSAYDGATLLLQQRIWPLWSHTRNRHAIRPGDQAAIYLSGADNQVVIATASIKDITPWTQSIAATYPPTLDGTPAKVLHLTGVMSFNHPRAIRPCLPQLSFLKNPQKWGVAFMGGTRALTRHDYVLLTTHAATENEPYPV